MAFQSNLDELWRLVREIPRGRVVAYGALGARLKNPASGYMVGRWMARAPEGVPWWRVVAKSGRLVVERRDPRLGLLQREILVSEGVRFENDVVCQEFFLQD